MPLTTSRRHRKWKLTRGEESDTDSGGESGGEVCSHLQFPRQTVFDELGIAKTIVPFLSIFVFINFQGKPCSIHFELRRKFYPLFLSSSTFQVGEDGSDTDWNMTVRLPEGLPEDFDYSEPVNIVMGEKIYI